MNASDFLPAEFNVATWFVDRPVAEGRGAAPAFHCEDRVLTYADVQELANRTGNALRELGVEMARAETVGTDPEFVAAVRDLIAERAWGWPERAALGKLPANHDVCPLDCCPAPQRPAGAGRPAGPAAAGGRTAARGTDAISVLYEGIVCL